MCLCFFPSSASLFCYLIQLVNKTKFIQFIHSRAYGRGRRCIYTSTMREFSTILLYGYTFFSLLLCFLSFYSLLFYFLFFFGARVLVHADYAHRQAQAQTLTANGKNTNDNYRSENYYLVSSLFLFFFLSSSSFYLSIR